MLSPFAWDHLTRLSNEPEGRATPNQVLIAVLQARGPGDLAQAAEDLERFLSLPAEQTGVGEPWEERNIRIPVELRKHLDGLRDSLKAAGLGSATRSHLIAASLMLRWERPSRRGQRKPSFPLRGPATPEEARELMAERQAEAFHRALAAEDTPG